MNLNLLRLLKEKSYMLLWVVGNHYRKVFGDSLVRKEVPECFCNVKRAELKASWGMKNFQSRVDVLIGY